MAGDAWLVLAGQLGTATSRSEATSVLASGSAHMCGLRPDGTVVCWGDDEYGQSAPPDETFG